MAAVLGLTEEVIKTALEKLPADEAVDIANLNCPGQIVISGSKKGIEHVGSILKESGAKRVLPLNVNGPFHSRLMKAANEELTTYITNIQMQDESIPVYTNVTDA